MEEGSKRPRKRHGSGTGCEPVGFVRGWFGSNEVLIAKVLAAEVCASHPEELATRQLSDEAASPSEAQGSP